MADPGERQGRWSASLIRLSIFIFACPARTFRSGRRSEWEKGTESTGTTGLQSIWIQTTDDRVRKYYFDVTYRSWCRWRGALPVRGWRSGRSSRWCETRRSCGPAGSGHLQYNVNSKVGCFAPNMIEWENVKVRFLPNEKNLRQAYVTKQNKVKKNFNLPIFIKLRCYR